MSGANTLTPFSVVNCFTGHYFHFHETFPHYFTFIKALNNYENRDSGEAITKPCPNKQGTSDRHSPYTCSSLRKSSFKNLTSIDRLLIARYLYRSFILLLLSDFFWHLPRSTCIYIHQILLLLKYTLLSPYC